MTDPQDCWDKLRQSAEARSNDPRKAAVAVVRKFAAGASKAEFELLRRRLEDTLAAGRYTDVPIAYLDQHSRWLAALEGACVVASEYGPRARSGGASS